jgi:ankyrin repeat protein
MKIQLTLITLLWVFSAPLLAQVPEPKQVPEPEQTPDVVKVPQPGEAAVPAQAYKLPSVPESMDPREKVLFQSAYDGNLAEVQVLVAKGASVNLADEKLRTPLIMAAYGGHTSVVEFLVVKGADINHRDGDGMTALIHTSKRSFNETAAFLLKNGAEVNVQTPKKGITALMIAAVADNVELVRMLLDHGADANLTDIFGRTAKVLAQKKGNSAVVDMLSNPPKHEGKS